MAQQRFNPAQMNQKQMMNNQSMFSMQNLIQKVGNGKRKFKINFDKNTKIFLNKFCIDYKKSTILPYFNSTYVFASSSESESREIPRTSTNRASISSIIKFISDTDTFS